MVLSLFMSHDRMLKYFNPSHDKNDESESKQEGRAYAILRCGHKRLRISNS